MDIENKKIVYRSGPTPNLVSWKPGGDRLPMAHRVTGNRFLGAIALIIGAPWLHYSGSYLFEIWKSTGVDGGQFFLILLVLGGLVFTLFGFSQLVYREEYFIGEGGVTWKRFGLSGMRSWQESLSGYNGVLKEQQYHGYTEALAPNYQSRMSYTLFLEHDDPARRVKLYESTNILEAPSPDWERLWLHYAELFNLPLLEKTSEGVISSAIENRNQPLIDKLAGGSIKTQVFDLTSPRLPTGLSLDRQEDLWVLTLKPVPLLWSGITFLVIAIVFFVLANYLSWFANDTTAIVLGSVIGIASLLYITSMLKKFRHPDQVAVDDSTVCHRTWNHTKEGWDVKSLRIRDINRIALGTQTNRNQLEGVIVNGKNITLQFGTLLSARSRRRLRDLLLFLFSLPENRSSKR